MQSRFIAVEGPIGVGKSSLVDLLATRFNAVKVMEKIENPLQSDLFQQFTLCDYIFAKDKIFAYLNLDDSELMLYERIYALLSESLPRPDLVIYLQASTEVLVERIRKRRRDYEAEISAKYLEDLNQAYNYFFYHYKETPLLVINTTDIDFVENESDLEDLVAQIRSMGKGVQYYMPMSKR